ncbi:hypothetical protein BD779DRAFT_1782857 [Infundibulicybe gibba]|nr:hypothetical protein BD779DRAFT_1782857 [Infundibulicybe gibba]
MHKISLARHDLRSGRGEPKLGRGRTLAGYVHQRVSTASIFNSARAQKATKTQVGVKPITFHELMAIPAFNTLMVRTPKIARSENWPTERREGEVGRRLPALENLYRKPLWLRILDRCWDKNRIGDMFTLFLGSLGFRAGLEPFGTTIRAGVPLNVSNFESCLYCQLAAE